MVLPEELERGLIGRYARQRGGHVEQVAFVDPGEELAAEPGDDGQAGSERQRRGRQGDGRPAQREVDEGTVEADETAGERVVELRDHPSAQEAVAERRCERQRDQRRRGHHQRLRQDERPE